MKLFDYRTILLNQAKKRTTETLCGSSLCAYAHRKSNKRIGVSQAKLNNSVDLEQEVQALGLLVSVSSTHYCAYTSDLSNS